jgi:DNA (cytosine-5)-methyltransferase 1
LPQNSYCTGTHADADPPDGADGALADGADTMTSERKSWRTRSGALDLPTTSCGGSSSAAAAAGVPVGCLVVERSAMAAARGALSAAASAAGTAWIRPRGVRQVGDRFEIHLSVAGAIAMQSEAEQPAGLRPLLASGAAEWRPGTRCTHRPVVVEPSAGLPTLPADAPPSPPRFRYLELFAGIGGFRLALAPLGGHCVFASELAPRAAQVYADRFGAAVAGDVTELDAAALPEHDLLTGGFPCQSFTTAGDGAGLACPRGQIYLEICRVIAAKRPAAFLLENVPSLYTLGGGQFDADPTRRAPGAALRAIVDDLASCGYTVAARILGAHAYCPQRRDRLFLAGFRDPRAAARFVWPEPAVGAAQGAEAAGGYLTVRSLLEPEGSDAVAAAALSAEQWAKVAPKLKGRVAELDGTARTLMSTYRSGWHQHSEFIVRPDGAGGRFYTTRECARIMGFPDSFVVPGHPDRSRGPQPYMEYQSFYHMIGNAVCPPVVRAVAAAMLDATES